MSGIKQTYTLSIKNDAGASALAQTTVYTAVAEENFNTTCVGGGDITIALDVDVSQIVSFFVSSNKDLSMKTWVGGTSGTLKQTIPLVGGIALWWNTDAINTRPLTDDFDTVSFHNTGTAGVDDATIKAGFLLDVDS